MTQCRVTCNECPTDDRTGRPRRWRHNCVECAQLQADDHSRQTGHRNVELMVIDDLTVETVRSRQRARRAFWQARQMGLTDGA